MRDAPDLDDLLATPKRVTSTVAKLNHALFRRELITDLQNWKRFRANERMNWRTRILAYFVQAA